MVPRLVFVHGIGGPRRVEEDRERWTAALADGARKAGHAKAADALREGSLAEVVFAYYGDLFRKQGSQGVGDNDLSDDEAAILTAFLTEVVEAQRKVADDSDAGAELDGILARLASEGQAQGAGDVIRRLNNVATTMLDVWPWRRAGQWAGSKLLIRDFSQVARYLSRKPSRDGTPAPDIRIREVVAEALGPGPTVVVAHSLGSVVTFETLHEHTGAVPLLVTIGSPLAMRGIVLPHVRPRPLTAPAVVGGWLNYWDRDDIIVPRPMMEKDMVANAHGVRPVSVRVDSDGVWVHTATKYLASANVAGRVVEVLESLNMAL